MDSESHLLEEMGKLIPYIQEDFLISITNKGIVNRSKKDLEKIRDTIAFECNEKGELQGNIGGEVTVILNQNLQSSTCTCPSQNICKHVITALFYVKEYYETHKTEIPAQEEIVETKEEKKVIPYEALNNLTAEDAIAFVGKKEFNSMVRSIELKPEAKFDYGDLLTVTVASQNSKVYFPKENSLDHVLCSCKAKGVCKHKAYAVLSYLIQERKLPLQAEDDALQIGEKEQEFLLRVKKYVSSLLDRGLAGWTENEIQNMDKLYQRAYGMKLFHTASECKALSSELTLYFSKNVAFSMKKTMHLLCILYNRAEALLIKHRDNGKVAILAGKRREDSFLLDNLNFWGLGASCRLTQRKDLLVSAYLYCEELQSIQVLSTLRPMDRSITPEYLYHTGILWEDELPISKVSMSKMILRDAKISPGKLSGAKSTVCQMKGVTGEEEFQKIAVDDFGMLKEQLKKQNFQYFSFAPEAENVFLLKVHRFEKADFDKVEQKLKFTVYDAKDNPVLFEISYSKATEQAIRFWEYEKAVDEFSYILGIIREKGDILIGNFISGVKNGKVRNIFFKER